MENWRQSPAPIDSAQIKETMETDVVVIGLGYAGTAALRQLAEDGVRVIGIEEQSLDRYHTFGRDIGHINSSFLQKRGLPEVQPLDLFNEWMRRSGNRANPQLIMQFCQNCGDTFDWFTDSYSYEELHDVHVAYHPKGSEALKAASYEDAAINGYRFWFGTAQFPDPFGWPGGPTLLDIVKANHEKARRAGAELLFSTKAVQLTKAGDILDGVIVLDEAGDYKQIKANKAIILAAGDFSKDKDMIKDLCTDLVDLLRPDEVLRPGIGRDGSGIKMGVWAGGRLEPRSLPTMGANLLEFTGPCSYGSLWLNQNGDRFCNEIFGGTEFRGFPGKQDGVETVYCVFDEDIVKNEMQWAVPAHQSFDINTPGLAESLEYLNTHRDKTCMQITPPSPSGMTVTIYAGDSPEEVVAHAGLTGEVAKHAIFAIHRYNQLCKAGVDEDFGRDPRLLNPLEGRLYLQIAKPMSPMLVTVGGLVTNEHQQVLDQNFTPIPKLVATGNCCGRRFGTQYSTPISGVSIGIAMTLGRQAARHIDLLQ